MNIQQQVNDVNSDIRKQMTRTQLLNGRYFIKVLHFQKQMNTKWFDCIGMLLDIIHNLNGGVF